MQCSMYGSTIYMLRYKIKTFAIEAWGRMYMALMRIKNFTYKYISLFTYPSYMCMTYV